MIELTISSFDPAAFLASAGLGRKIVTMKAKHVFFAQGTPRTACFIYRLAAPNSL